MQDSQLLQRLRQAILEGDSVAATQLAEEAINAGLDARSLMNDGVQAALSLLGAQFESGDCYLPELILGGDAAKAAVDVLMPYLSLEEDGLSSRGRVVIGSSKGDMHDIGKNIVGALLAAAGWQVVDLGVDVPSKKFIEAAERERAHVIAMSSLLTTSLPYQQELVRLLVDSGQRNRYFVVVGGGPVTPQWAAQIGADGYGREAPDAVVLCRALLAAEQLPPLAKPLCVGALR